jgi:acylpyruvate hydrolase
MSSSSALPHFARACRNIVCVGRSYAAHAKELGNAVPSEPVLFLKPPSSLVPDGATVVIPRGLEEVHHEVELGIVIGRKTSHVSVGRDVCVRSVKFVCSR